MKLVAYSTLEQKAVLVNVSIFQRLCLTISGYMRLTPDVNLVKCCCGCLYIDREHGVSVGKIRCECPFCGEWKIV